MPGVNPLPAPAGLETVNPEKFTRNKFNPTKEPRQNSGNGIQQLLRFIMTLHLSQSRLASSHFIIIIIISPKGRGSD